VQHVWVNESGRAIVGNVTCLDQHHKNPTLSDGADRFPTTTYADH